MSDKFRKHIETAIYGLAVGAMLGSVWRYYQDQITIQKLSFNVALISFFILFNWKIAPSVEKWLDRKVKEMD